MALHDSLIARDLNVLWHPCAQMRDYRGPDGFPPLHVVRAEGTRIRLADGRELIDAISSWWCKSLGHGHPRLRAALAEQAERFEHVILANTTNEPIVRLSERLVALANHAAPEEPGAAGDEGPGDARHFAKVFFADNGSTAVEIAIKMALQAQLQRGQPQRTRLAALANGYHGETAAALSVSDCDLYRQHYGPLLFDVLKLAPVPYRTGPDDSRWQDAGEEWSQMESQLAPVADTLAAIIYEPVLQGAGNMRLYSPDLLRRLRAWADAHGVYLIADEIAAGCHRLGPFLASHLAAAAVAPPPAPRRTNILENVGTSSDDAPSHRGGLPDFACLSKGLTGGVLPLSAVLTTDAVYDLFDADYAEMKAFLHSNTYTGNALAVAVANAALDEYEQSDVLENVRTSGPLLRAGLADLAKTRPYLHAVRGCGMMAAVDITSGGDWTRRTGYRVYRHAVARPTLGALLRPIGDTMYLFPPLNTPPAEIDRTLAILAESLDAVVR